MIVAEALICRFASEDAIVTFYDRVLALSVSIFVLMLNLKSQLV